MQADTDITIEPIAITEANNLCQMVVFTPENDILTSSVFLF